MGLRGLSHFQFKIGVPAVLRLGSGFADPGHPPVRRVAEPVEFGVGRCVRVHATGGFALGGGDLIEDLAAASGGAVAVAALVAVAFGAVEPLHPGVAFVGQLKQQPPLLSGAEFKVFLDLGLGFGLP